VDLALGETQQAGPAAAGHVLDRSPPVGPAGASVTKVFACERLQQRGQLLEEIVGRHGDPAGAETAALACWLDIQAKRNTVQTSGGGGQRDPARTHRHGRPRAADGAAMRGAAVRESP